MDAMRKVVPATGAFFCFGTEDARAYRDSSRMVDGCLSALKGPSSALRLTHAFAFDTRTVIEATRRVYMTREPYPNDRQQQLPYIAAQRSDAMKHALLFCLHEGGVLFGLAGLERRAAEGEFSPEDVHRIEALGPFVVAGSAA